MIAVWNTLVLVEWDTDDADSQSAADIVVVVAAADSAVDECAVVLAFDSIAVAVVVAVARVVGTLELEMVVSNHHQLSTV